MGLAAAALLFACSTDERLRRLIAVELAAGEGRGVKALVARCAAGDKGVPAAALVATSAGLLGQVAVEAPVK